MSLDDALALTAAAVATLALLLPCRAVWRRTLRSVRDDLGRAEAEGRPKNLTPRTFAALCLATAMPILCGLAVVKVWEVGKFCGQLIRNLELF